MCRGKAVTVVGGPTSSHLRPPSRKPTPCVTENEMTTDYNNIASVIYWFRASTATLVNSFGEYSDPSSVVTQQAVIKVTRYFVVDSLSLSLSLSLESYLFWVHRVTKFLNILLPSAPFLDDALQAQVQRHLSSSMSFTTMQDTYLQTKVRLKYPLKVSIPNFKLIRATAWDLSIQLKTFELQHRVRPIPCSRLPCAIFKLNF